MPDTEFSADKTPSVFQTLLTIFFLIIFFPIGVILLWAWMPWKTWIKTLITLIGCLPIAFVGFLLIFWLIAASQTNNISDDPCIRDCMVTGIDQETCVNTCYKSLDSN